MTNLDSIFKSRDITLPTKVRLVKAMVFPVVMYGCESWTVKKAKLQRIDAFGESKRQMTNVYKDVGKSESSNVAGGNVECYAHSLEGKL